MNRKSFINIIIQFIFMLCAPGAELQAQQSNCVLLPPTVSIDFGSGLIRDINTALPKYRHDLTTCPDDGFYSYVSHTSDCFNGDWLTFNTDHTSNAEGNMMLVNASKTGGVFFNTSINGLKANTKYQFAAWMVNICRINGGCSPLPPNITVRLLTVAGKEVAEFVTGQLAQMDVPHWKKYFAFFVTPPDVSTVIISMEDNTLGGCGNDFAMDDITFCECIKPLPPVHPEITRAPKPAVKTPFIIKPPPKKTTAKPAAGKKDTTALIAKKSVANIPVMTSPSIKENPFVTGVPQLILTRENPVIQHIETIAGEMIIDLYDNATIDNDTVSIYHNNKLIISRAGLSAKPIHFKITINAIQPHHELVMVANNLGSIPPNTSLMIITVNNKRYEVHISSSEQKNAKVVIDLKE